MHLEERFMMHWAARQLNNTEYGAFRKKRKKVACVSLLDQTHKFELHTEISFLTPDTLQCWIQVWFIVWYEKATLSKTLEKHFFGEQPAAMLLIFQKEVYSGYELNFQLSGRSKIQYYHKHAELNNKV